MIRLLQTPARRWLRCMACATTAIVLLAGCANASKSPSKQVVVDEAPQSSQTEESATTEGQDAAQNEEAGQSGPVADESPASEKPATAASPTELRAQLNITEDFRSSFIHGEKPAEFQKYIVFHDTEGDAVASNVIEWWDSNGKFVASHYVVNKDGSIVQCVPVDKIAHHAGYGDAGHNEQFGVTDESRDDKRGTEPIGDWAPDYGMNSYSVGIEMVHTGTSGEDYPEEQLRAVDGIIAYLDAYYGFESTIIDHNDWRTGNSDCSEEFQPYLRNLQETRTHDGS